MAHNLAHLALRVSRGERPQTEEALLDLQEVLSREKEPTLDPTLFKSAISGGEDFINLLTQRNIPFSKAAPYLNIYQQTRKSEQKAAQEARRAELAELRLDLTEREARLRAERPATEARKLEFEQQQLKEQGYKLTPSIRTALLIGDKDTLKTELLRQDQLRTIMESPEVQNVMRTLPDPAKYAHKRIPTIARGRASGLEFRTFRGSPWELVQK